MPKKKKLTFTISEMGKAVTANLDVVPAPRESVLHRLRPSRIREKQALLAKVVAAIDGVLEGERSALAVKTAQVAAMGTAAEHVYERTRTAKLGVIESKRKNALGYLADYSVATLRVLSDVAGEGGVDSILYLLETGSYYSEAQIRELLSYRDFSRLTPETMLVLINIVKLHDERFAHEDLSVLEGKDRADAQALYSIMQEVLILKMNELKRPSFQRLHPQRKLDDAMWQLIHEYHLSEMVADLVIAFPDRIPQIADYIFEHGWELSDSEIDRFALMLDNEATSLSQGVL